MIEIHINNKNKGKKDFFRLIAQTILVAKSKGLNATFFSAHYSKEKLQSIFGEALVIESPNILNIIDVAIAKIFYWKNKVPNTGTVLKYTILTNKLSNDKLDTLKNLGSKKRKNNNT
ncbi:hypothetical protein V1503_19545 [Bacillus sp. SCS-151]|uniref:hypothetical protein n=1 Tax=Nanhaiella sioensis TaxID=3115293 RepID=UPI00397D1F58